MKYVLVLLYLISVSAVIPNTTEGTHQPPGKISFTLQKRIPAATKDSFVIVKETQQWDPAETAFIICDMWNQHWCKGATARVGELAPKMNRVLNIARSKGALIVHSPSDCMNYYKDHPARKLAEKYAVATSETPDGSDLLPSEQGATWPIDQSNGGCTDTPRCTERNAWTKQSDLLEIKANDVISDNGQEIEGVLKARGIKHVVLMGVHTNMCIVNRSFGMRNMNRYGLQTVLMRDLTDAMYDPRQQPYVDHFKGLELMIGYIEKYIGPTVLSTDLTGEPAFRFAEDTRMEQN